MKEIRANGIPLADRLEINKIAEPDRSGAVFSP
jgi:hypothetical protein